MRRFSAPQRQRCLERLEREQFDLLVIGGGLIGTAIARDASLRGLSVALLEKGDLAGGECRLVWPGPGSGGPDRMSHREQAVLQRVAYHRVKPITFLRPVYTDSSLRPWQLGLSLTVRDLMGFWRNLEPHRRLAVPQALERSPTLRSHGMAAAYLYHDYLVDDALLVMDMARSAFFCGAALVPHAEVTDLSVPGAARAVDRLQDCELRLRARVTICAIGASHRLGRRPAHHARTVQVAVQRRRLRLAEAVVTSAGDGDRTLACLPWGQVVLLTSTEVGIPGPADLADVDVECVLQMTNRAFPGLRLTREDVLGADSGLSARVPTWNWPRPRVPVLREESPGAFVVVAPPGRSHRCTASDAIDRAFPRAGPCRTDRQPLLWGDERWGRLTEAAADQPEELLERLRRDHPVTWPELAAIAAEGGDRALPVFPDGPLGAEVVYAVRHQMALRLADLVEHRLRLRLTGAERARRALAPLAELMGQELGWTPSRRQAEIETTRRSLDEAIGRRRRLGDGSQESAQPRP